MTEQMQQFALARAQGFEEVWKAANAKVFGANFAGRRLDSDEILPVPDYLKDRNAMHKIFVSLVDDQKVDCLGFLYEVARSNHRDKDVALAMATLPQWANAILRATGRWKD